VGAVFVLSKVVAHNLLGIRHEKLRPCTDSDIKDCSQAVDAALLLRDSPGQQYSPVCCTMSIAVCGFSLNLRLQGKSHLINELIKSLESVRKKCELCGLTGVAAANIRGELCRSNEPGSISAAVPTSAQVLRDWRPLFSLRETLCNHLPYLEKIPLSPQRCRAHPTQPVQPGDCGVPEELLLHEVQPQRGLTGGAAGCPHHCEYWIYQPYIPLQTRGCRHQGPTILR
jgi:hypothetical protein